MTPEAQIIDDGLLAEAWTTAAACGVTRLADITGLDRLDVPVFQAIRPASRALAVHQGKAFDPTVARLTALMEAIESDHAERFARRSHACALDDLPPAERPAHLADFARTREDPPGRDEPLAWARAERILDGTAIQVPLDCVSLDFIGAWDRRLDHTSNGMGARFDLEGAILKALLEVIERDAIGVWRSRAMALRAVRKIDASTIRAPWFTALSGRIAGLGLRLSLHSLPTLAGLSTVRAELQEPRTAAVPGRSALGAACAADPAAALQGAILEALQSRLGVISGARDDILYRGEPGPMGETCPLPPNIQPLDWETLAQATGPATSSELAGRLAALGYPDACFVRLSEPEARIQVVKAFVPGLAAFGRARRPV